MPKDTKNFKASEFTCKCGCGSNNISQTLINTLQRIRDKLGLPITIKSGYRCPSHNKKEGGKANSAHVKGTAVDIKVNKTDSAFRYKLIAHALGEGINRIGIGTDFVHLDIDRGLPQYQIWVY